MRFGSSDGTGYDGAVSPVIAVILMVAITVVLAATVYVWVSGFTDTGEQAPDANIGHVSCDVGNDGVTFRLRAGGPVQKEDVTAILYNDTDDTEEARTDPLDDGGGQGYDAGQWQTGEQVEIDDPNVGGTSAQPNWDSSLSSSGGLDDGTPYSVDWVHKPTDQTFASVSFTC